LLNRILNSPLFKFTVGEEIDGIASQFSIHEEAIAPLSAPLRRMIKGGLGGQFSESQAGATMWPDVGKETFERFVQFAYNCDYTVPKPVIRKIDPDSVPASSQTSESDPTDAQIPHPLGNLPPSPAVEITPYTTTPDMDWENWGVSLKSKKQRKKRAENEKEVFEIKARGSGPMLAENFHALSYPLLAPRNRSVACDLSLPFSENLDYSNILLCHATLYVFGDLWMIDSLKALTLFKLHETLCAFQLDDTNAEDIVELARYAYLDEGKGSDEGIGGLRNLVCQYMASNAVVLSLDQGFMALLEEGGEFVRDLWRFEVQRH
jgi:hypothetical protein